jgi:hypothetical protein
MMLTGYEAGPELEQEQEQEQEQCNLHFSRDSHASVSQTIGGSAHRDLRPCSLAGAATFY